MTLTVISTRRWPMRSPMDPVNGAEMAEANVRKPRKRPAAVVPPPRSRTWYGAVGSNWKTETKTVKLYAHMMKKRGVNRRSDMRRSFCHAGKTARQFSRRRGGLTEARAGATQRERRWWRKRDAETNDA